MSNPGIHEHHLTVSRTARYYTLGNAEAPAQLWFLLHGHGQLAGRFLRAFTALDDGTRLLVAPEALSRYYLDAGEHGPGSRVGGTWMTREDRLSEINDYVAYLDALHTHLVRSLGGAHPALRVLGFSQGAATAARWTAMGRARVDRLILWGGFLPPDLDLATGAGALRQAGLTVALGRNDDYVTAERRAELERRASEHAVPLRLVEFDGGHRIDLPTLLAIARE